MRSAWAATPGGSTAPCGVLEVLSVTWRGARDIVTADDGASQEQLWAAVGLFDPDAWASMCARIGATGSAIPTVTNGSSTVRRRGSRTNPAMDRTS